MPLFSRDELYTTAELVHARIRPTAEHCWPLINETVGTEVWVKHENHTATGAFKIRGGITIVDWLTRTHPNFNGIVTATRGNHGQSQARAATAVGLRAKIVVPRGNSIEKNNAMRAFGAELITAGHDFDTAKEVVKELAEAENLFPVPPFHKQIALGVATYALEMFTQVPDIDTVYVPIGCGSGICGLITTRDLLGLRTAVVGVVSTEAGAAKASVESGRLIETRSANTFADGMAVRAVVPEAYDIYSAGAERIVAVSDDEIASAIRIYYQQTHNIAEGAGAAALAALLQEKTEMAGKKVAVVLTGGNIDTDTFVDVMRGKTPEV